MDRGFFLTLQAMRRQLAAMPCDLYRIVLIHGHTRKVLPGERIWSAVQLSHGAMVRFLRLCNREGHDVYFQPFAGNHNAGYILVDLDQPEVNIVDTMRANGHQPCVVLETSPGHLQAWVRVRATPLEPAVATAIGRHLARAYGGDRASIDWRHLGRLAGFTNQKPTRRHSSGYAPWVKLLHAQIGVASHGASLVQAAQHHLSALAPLRSTFPPPHRADSPACRLTPAAASDIYSRWLDRLHIPQRFSPPDWSIADLWITKELLRHRTPLHQIQAILRLGSPGFPRRHGDPEDYLRRTLARAAWELNRTLFSARCSPPRPPSRVDSG